MLAKIPVGPPVSGPVVRWMEEWGYPSQITTILNGNQMTFSGNLFGQAITAESVKKVIRAGTILERPSDGVQVKVSSVNALTASVAAYGNTVLSNDAQTVGWDIISEVWSDYRDASDPRSLDRVFREVGTQIHAETFEIPKTRKNTKYEIIANETEHQIHGASGKAETAACVRGAEIQTLSRRHGLRLREQDRGTHHVRPLHLADHHPGGILEPQRVREQETPRP